LPLTGSGWREIAKRQTLSLSITIASLQCCPRVFEISSVVIVKPPDNFKGLRFSADQPRPIIGVEAGDGVAQFKYADSLIG
jgi:hypothetical protein